MADPVSSHPLVASKGTLGQIRRYVVGIVVGVVFLAGAAVRSEMAARDAHDAAVATKEALAEVKAEVAHSAAERCRVTLLSRAGSLEKDIRIFTRLGHEFGASQARIDEFIDGIREDYAALPIPSDCQDDDKEEP